MASCRSAPEPRATRPLREPSPGRPSRPRARLVCESVTYPQTRLPTSPARSARPMPLQLALGLFQFVALVESAPIPMWAIPAGSSPTLRSATKRSARPKESSACRRRPSSICSLALQTMVESVP